MNWLLINHSNTLHGAERVCVSTVQALISKGEHVTVVVPANQPETDFIEALPEEVEVIKLTYKAIGNSLLRTLFVQAYNLPAIRELEHLCKEKHIDRIYANTYIIALGAQLAARTHLPLYWHIHEEPTSDFFWRPNMSSLMRKQFSQAHLIFISKRQKTLWEQALHTSLQGEIIYNPVRHIAVTKEPHEGVVFGYIGNFEKRKNVPMLINCFKQLRQQHSDIRLLLWGAKETDDMPATEGIEVVRHNPQVEQFYRQTDVLVLPSLRETMPLVVMEAMMADVAVIQTSESGMNELFQDHKETLFFSPTAPEQLLSCMQNLLDKDKRQAIATQGKEGTLAFIENNNYQQAISTYLCK